jgi:hypothetical protein
MQALERPRTPFTLPGRLHEQPERGVAIKTDAHCVIADASLARLGCLFGITTRHADLIDPDEMKRIARPYIGWLPAHGAQSSLDPFFTRLTRK